MKQKFLLASSLFIILLGTSLTFGQDKKAAPVVKGFKAETVGLISFAEQRFTALANAIPEDKYDYRPGEGVRSVREVLTHMIQANYGLPGVIGAKPPADAPKDFKELKDKKQIIASLKRSFEHTRNVVNALSKADFDKDKKFLGNDTTYRGVISFMNAHTNQHLGQLIAYARVNGITPPWSAGTN
jgi:uncharacterized damage-inducible protein DinB